MGDQMRGCGAEGHACGQRRTGGEVDSGILGNIVIPKRPWQLPKIGP